MLLWKNKIINAHPKTDHVRLSAFPSNGKDITKVKYLFRQFISIEKMKLNEQQHLLFFPSKLVFCSLSLGI